jgi:hypothetical protein
VEKLEAVSGQSCELMATEHHEDYRPGRPFDDGTLAK